MSFRQKSLEKEKMDFPDEVVEKSSAEDTGARSGLGEKEQAALTRRILLKLDFR